MQVLAHAAGYNERLGVRTVWLESCMKNARKTYCMMFITEVLCRTHPAQRCTKLDVSMAGNAAAMACHGPSCDCHGSSWQYHGIAMALLWHCRLPWLWHKAPWRCHGTCHGTRYGIAMTHHRKNTRSWAIVAVLPLHCLHPFVTL